MYILQNAPILTPLFPSTSRWSSSPYSATLRTFLCNEALYLLWQMSDFGSREPHREIKPTHQVKPSRHPGLSLHTICYRMRTFLLYMLYVPQIEFRNTWQCVYTVVQTLEKNTRYCVEEDEMLPIISLRSITPWCGTGIKRNCVCLTKKIWVPMQQFMHIRLERSFNWCQIKVESTYVLR